MTETPLAAIVMAGGLGTRMKSAVPKHFHPILGRRMVDWVIESGRRAGASPLVVATIRPSGMRNRTTPSRSRTRTASLALAKRPKKPAGLVAAR